MYRTKRVCQDCGRPFEGVGDRHYCDACSKKRKSESVIRPRTCVDCGNEFIGGPRAKRCPSCRAIAQKETAKRYRDRGACRPLGSTDKCVLCDKIYVVTSGRQMYCPSCRRQANLEWQKIHKKGYSKSPAIKGPKQEKRRNQKKLFAYCQRPFLLYSNESYCSEYCRMENKRIQQCASDIARGQKRNMQKYLDARERYRKDVKEVT